MTVSDTIQTIANYFDLGTVRVLDLNPLGNGNKSYFIETQSGEVYVLRFLHDQTLEGLRNERAIEEQLTAVKLRFRESRNPPHLVTQ